METNDNDYTHSNPSINIKKVEESNIIIMIYPIFNPISKIVGENIKKRR